jgi:4-alpha-glucanotransferase
MTLPQVHFDYSASREEALHRAAVEWGIEREFWDIFGHQHIASADTEAKILAALGVDVSTKDSIDRARRSRFERLAASVVSDTSVIAENDKAVFLSLLSGPLPEIQLDLALENGSQLSSNPKQEELTAARTLELDGRQWTVYRVPLHHETPLGYHTLRVTLNREWTKESRVIICPERAYIPHSLANGGRTAGIGVTLWGLRSGRNWGCGDFTDLHALIDWVAEEIRGSFIALNPLHILSNRVPYNTSPYLPLSIFYRNFIYLDIERVPEFQQSAWARRALRSAKVAREIEELRQSEFVEYERVSRLKLRFLRALYRCFRQTQEPGSERARQFSAYCQREGSLLDKLSLFCALDEVVHRQDKNKWTWRDWPTHYQDPDSEACRNFARDYGRTVEFYKYVQFVIEEQLAEAQRYTKQRGLEIGLYHDLALATDNCGSDLWAHRNFYVPGCRVGSPPDAFAPKGQDWAFPPPNTIAHAENGYELFRESIRKIVSHGGALRIDHVMRLFRLFWMPDGVEAEHGVYVKDNVEDLLHILALESVRAKNVIIGEDLGTVTEEMRETLARFGILSYRLFYFEKHKDDSFKASYEYPHQALVASTTHDLATIAGYWLSRDIEARHNAGLIDDGGFHHQLENRRKEKQRMLDQLHAEKLLPEDYPRDASQIPELDGILHNAVVAFLAQTPSALLLLNQEDLTKETEQQNLPGSTSEYPNWRRKMKFQLENLRTEAAGYAAMVRYHLERTGRMNPL